MKHLSCKWQRRYLIFAAFCLPIQLWAQDTWIPDKQIAVGAHSRQDFSPLGRVISLYKDRVVVRIHQEKLAASQLASVDLKAYFSAKEQAQDRNSLIIRDGEANVLASFLPHRFEYQNTSQARESHLLLYGHLQLATLVTQEQISVGYEVGIYKQVPGYLGPPVQSISQQVIRSQLPTRSIRNHKDNKEMLYIGADMVVYGQNVNPALDNFNPYFSDHSAANAVRIGAFYMDKYEVTNGEYLYFCHQTDHPLPPSWQERSKYPPYSTYPPGRKDHPFRQASYVDAVAYAKWAQKRLPTELEWEMAARGGFLYWSKQAKKGEQETVRVPPIYSMGDNFDTSVCNTLESGIQDSLAIYVLKDKSPYGIFGLCGNVAEWTSSWYSPYRGHHWSKKAVSGKVFKVIRGGSFATNKEMARADYRGYGGLPSLRLDHSAGFRLVISAPK